MPERIQLRRTKGWRKPEGVVSCARPGPYGNPFPVPGLWSTWAAVALGFRGAAAGRRQAAVALHRAWLTGEPITAEPPLVGGGSIEFSDGRTTTTPTLGEHVTRCAVGFASLFPSPTLPDRPDLERLRGRDLACWCPLDQPCHADVLLEWANR